MEICRHGCLDHCQSSGSESLGHYIQERNDVNAQQPHEPVLPANSVSPSPRPSEDGPPVYDDVVHNGDEVAAIGGHFLGVEKSAAPKAQAQMANQRVASTTAEPAMDASDDPDLSFLVRCICITVIFNRLHAV